MVRTRIFRNRQADPVWLRLPLSVIDMLVFVMCVMLYVCDYAWR